MMGQNKNKNYNATKKKKKKKKLSKPITVHPVLNESFYSKSTKLYQTFSFFPLSMFPEHDNISLIRKQGILDLP